MDLYVKLADHISDVFSLGLMPHHKESAFVQVFDRLLSEEEVRLCLLLDDKLKSSKDISMLCNGNILNVNDKLSEIAKKGIIYEEYQDGIDSSRTYYYKLLPYVPGIFEAVGASLDEKEIAECLHKYTEEMRKLKKEFQETKHGEKCIPIDHEISLEVTRASMTEISAYLNHTEHYALMDCICRKIQKMEGRSCGHTIKDMCMIIGDYAEYYVRMGTARRATRSEMEYLLEQAEQEGLYHELYPIEQGKNAFLCNCCTCGCMFMGLANRISKVISYKNKIIVNETLCNCCGKCINVCPENVFSFKDGKILFNQMRCFACGLCSLSCPQNAIMI